MNGRTNSNDNSTMTILGDGIPLDPPSSFLCEARNSKVDITWIDPKDKYATPEGEQMEDTDQLVSVWSYTKIVRKEGSQPTSPSDGVTVCTNTTRNQYQSTIFEDTSVTNGVTYYYAAYAYNTAGTYSDGAFSDGITPIEWDPVLANNSWEQIDSACTQGVAQSMWSVGDEKNDGSYPMVILAFNHVNLVEGGTGTITFGSKGVFACPNQAEGGYGPDRPWPQTVMGTWVINTLISTFSQSLQNVIRSSIGYYNFEKVDDAYLWESERPFDRYPSHTYNSKLLVYTGQEVLGGVAEQYGPGYGQYPYYATTSNRIKDSKYWVLSDIIYADDPFSSTHDDAYYMFINPTGNGISVRHGYDLNEDGIFNAAIVFCIGKSST